MKKLAKKLRTVRQASKLLSQRSLGFSLGQKGTSKLHSITYFGANTYQDLPRSKGQRKTGRTTSQHQNLDKTEHNFRVSKETASKRSSQFLNYLISELWRFNCSMHLSLIYSFFELSELTLSTFRMSGSHFFPCHLKPEVLKTFETCRQLH